jgi:hypothetical protein
MDVNSNLTAVARDKSPGSHTLAPYYVVQEAAIHLNHFPMSKRWCKICHTD